MKENNWGQGGGGGGNKLIEIKKVHRAQLQHDSQAIVLAQQQDSKLPSSSRKSFGAKEHWDSLNAALLEEKLE